MATKRAPKPKRPATRRKSATTPKSESPRPAPKLQARASREAPAEASTAARAPIARAARKPNDVPLALAAKGLAIVGLGSSAGGLEALEGFFDHLLPNAGIAIVVVTHQQAGHATLLPELLGRHTKLPVTIAEPQLRVEANRVYVSPPGYLEIEGGRFKVLPLDEARPHLPIDHFFRSLARHSGQSAAAIVLSGNGSDGTLGVREIKEHNGMVMAQDPATARYSSMPASAVATQLVDFVLPPEQLAPELVRCLRARPGQVLAVLEEDDVRAALQRVMTALRQRTGNDFSAYKKSTIMRRVERRMAVHGLSSAREYAALIEHTPYEVDALFKEVLISVTSFFRDPEAYVSLEAELAKTLAQKPDDSLLRGWIPGCATGEEAYSFAILIHELLDKLGKQLKVQIFATDLDQHAIDFARNGCYLSSIVADVSPARLERYFSKEDDNFRVSKDIREMVVFATQNVVKDPPFTKLDFVSCRNLLIYLEPELQKRVLSLFAYSLYPGGLMVLGTSESINGFDDRFVTMDKKWKLFRRQEVPGSMATVFDFPADVPPQTARVPAVVRTSRPTLGIAPLAERLLLSHFTPPSAIISDRGEIIFLHGSTGPFLEPVPGEPSHNLFNMAREGLRLELPAAVRQASTQGAPVVRKGLQVRTNGGFSMVTVSVRRLHEPEIMRGAYLVSFEIEPTPKAAPKNRVAPATSKQSERISRLELDLQRTSENLQGTIEELETSNEELKSMNEELQSTNEELQSANEELETSREEMQSLNEELQTVNAELEERNHALSQANDDMQNLLNSTEVATVFLDDKLAIKRFTTQAKKVFSLIDTDVGRPISDLTANLRYTGLLEEAAEVLRTLVFREREIQTKEGAWRLMRIMPYRTHENLIDGLVITFVDIDRIKRAEQSSSEARSYAENIVDSLTQSLLVLDADLTVVSANRAFYETFRLLPRHVVGERLENVSSRTWGEPIVEHQLRELANDGAAFTRLQLDATGESVRGRTFFFSGRSLGQADGRSGLLLLLVEEMTASGSGSPSTSMGER